MIVCIFAVDFRNLRSEHFVKHLKTNIICFIYLDLNLRQSGIFIGPSTVFSMIIHENGMVINYFVSNYTVHSQERKKRQSH